MRDRAEVVQDVLGGDGGGPDARLGEGQVLRDGRVEVVADHQHVEVFLDGVDGVRPGRVGGRRQYVRLRDDRDDVGCVPAAGALGVVGVDGPRPAMAARVSSTNPASFNVSVWMASWAPVCSHTVRHASIAAGVAPQSSWILKPTAPARSWSCIARLVDGVALAEQPDVDRVRLQRREHPRQVPAAGGDGGGLGALRGSGAAADDGGDARGQRLVHQGRRDEVDVGVDGAGGEDACRCPR